jgi:hypothetical protein
LTFPTFPLKILPLPLLPWRLPVVFVRRESVERQRPGDRERKQRSMFGRRQSGRWLRRRERNLAEASAKNSKPKEFHEIV